MVAIKSRKPALGFRVSTDIYNRVRALTEGDNPPYESISDYLNFVIAQDLARRELGVDYIMAQILTALDNPIVVEALKTKLKNQ